MLPTRLGLAMAAAVTMAVTLLPAPAAGAGGDVRVAPARIASDCSVDVSTRLQRWLQAVPDGATARLRAGGCYRVETELVVRRKSDVLLDGAGATLRRTTYTAPARRYPRSNALLRLVDFTDSRVTGLRLRGTNTAPDLSFLPSHAGSYRQEVEFDHGLALSGLVRTTVDHVAVRSVWGDGVYLSGTDQWSHRVSQDVVLRKVRVTQNGRQGITINRSKHILLDRVRVTFSRRAAIDLEPDRADETISDIEIRNSDLGSNLVAISAHGAGRVNQVNVHHNRIHRTAVPWVYVRSSLGLDRHDWSVHDNVVNQVLGSPMPALAFWNTRGIDVRGNRMAFTTAQSQKAVGLWAGSRRATIRCNLFLGARTRFVDGNDGAAVTEGNRLTPAPRTCDGVRRQELDVPLPTLWVGDVAPVVRYVERRLGVQPADLRFDTGTQNRVGALQAQHGMETSGVVDASTWKLVLSLPR